MAANQTLYVNNLNDKINVETLKKSLKEVFAAFGGIIDIVAMKSLKRRGQAWIIFKEVSAATNSLKSLQGFPFYNKPMRIAYSRSKSDVVAKADGTYVERPKKIVKREDVRKKSSTAPSVPQETIRAPEPSQPTASQKSIQDRIGWNPNQTTAASAPAKPAAPSEPNKTLFVENLPPEATDTMLSRLYEFHSPASYFLSPQRDLGGGIIRPPTPRVQPGGTLPCFLGRTFVLDAPCVATNRAAIP